MQAQHPQPGAVPAQGRCRDSLRACERPKRCRARIGEGGMEVMLRHPQPSLRQPPSATARLRRALWNSGGDLHGMAAVPHGSAAFTEPKFLEVVRQLHRYAPPQEPLCLASRSTPTRPRQIREPPSRRLFSARGHCNPCVRTTKSHANTPRAQIGHFIVLPPGRDPESRDLAQNASIPRNWLIPPIPRICEGDFALICSQILSFRRHKLTIGRI